MTNNSTNLELDKEYSLWYHNPNDTNWTESSYHQILSFNTTDEFWVLDKLFNNDFIENGMFFVMKENIVPIWENDKNIDGGYISWKVDKKNVYSYWIDLIGHMITNNIFEDENNEDCKDNKNDKNYSNIINGCSISPKKNFNILKLWTKEIVDLESLKFSDSLKLSEFNSAFKSHQHNIEKDTKMKQSRT
jgi:hypothetical protein